ncbi:MAG: hypothetical protein EPN50_01680, partial [Chloroflexota bacterium]
MDAPIQLADPRLQARLLAAIDSEGKIPRALDELGPVRERRVLLLDAAAQGHLARALRNLGARLTTRRSRTGPSSSRARGILPSLSMAAKSRAWSRGSASWMG